jgi:hypothetical protein
MLISGLLPQPGALRGVCRGPPFDRPGVTKGGGPCGAGHPGRVRVSCWLAGLRGCDEDRGVAGECRESKRVRQARQLRLVSDYN